MRCQLTVLLFVLGVSSGWGALTDGQRQEFVDIHNYLRRSVAPVAADMQELVYNTSIEEKVNEYLELCKFEHRRKDGFGENGRLATDANITNTVFSWFQERVYFDISLPYEDPKRCTKENSAVDYLGEVQCGHYIMMAKSTVQSIGCGIKQCRETMLGSEVIKNNYITFCFYNSGAQNPPYEVGNTCSSCNNDYPFCHNNMCVPKKSYDVSVRDCKLRCNNCAPPFNYPKDCLCVCPDNTRSGACLGTPKSFDEPCSPCQQVGRTCLNGGKEESTAAKDKCKCICPDGFQGDSCEVRKVVYDNSHEYSLDGLPWRYSMTTPANIIQFTKSYKEFQNTISRDISELCEGKSKTLSAEMVSKCKDIVGSSLNPDNVLLVPGYPYLHKNGSLMIRMFMNYSSGASGPIKESFVSPVVMAQIWSQPSSQLSDLITNARQVYPKVTTDSSTVTAIPTTTGQNTTIKITTPSRSARLSMDIRSILLLAAFPVFHIIV